METTPAPTDVQPATTTRRIEINWQVTPDTRTQAHQEALRRIQDNPITNVVREFGQRENGLLAPDISLSKDQLQALDNMGKAIQDFAHGRRSTAIESINEDNLASALQTIQRIQEARHSQISRQNELRQLRGERPQRSFRAEWSHVQEAGGALRDHNALGIHIIEQASQLRGQDGQVDFSRPEVQRALLQLQEGARAMRPHAQKHIDEIHQTTQMLIERNPNQRDQFQQAEDTYLAQFNQENFPELTPPDNVSQEAALAEVDNMLKTADLKDPRDIRRLETALGIEYVKDEQGQEVRRVKPGSPAERYAVLRTGAEHWQQQFNEILEASANNPGRAEQLVRVGLTAVTQRNLLRQTTANIRQQIVASRHQAVARITREQAKSQGEVNQLRRANRRWRFVTRITEFALHRVSNWLGLNRTREQRQDLINQIYNYSGPERMQSRADELREQISAMQAELNRLTGRQPTPTTGQA